MLRIPLPSLLALSCLAPGGLFADVFTNVPEAAGYSLVYDLNILNDAAYGGVTLPSYTVNNAASIAPGSFGRIAYYLELDNGSGSQWVYASMDRFTAYADRTGVPYLGSLGSYQQTVSNVNVASNVGGIATGLGRTGYNLEFWPTNYEVINQNNIPNASGTLFDWGDRRTPGNYGSMQIHDHASGVTLFAYNNWAGAANNSDLGIGNNTVLTGTNTVANPDWTFRSNAGDYTTIKRMQILVGGSAPAMPTVGAGAPAQVYSNAPETQGMVHALTLAIPQTGNAWNGQGVPYSVNNSALIQPGSFNRVGYYLELQPTAGGDTQWVFVSGDAFTGDPNKIGVPTLDTGAFFQRNFDNMTVRSNVAGIVTGTGITTGNLEFWPSNYNGNNTRLAADGGPVPNATSGFDFGDGGASLAAGHGSFQIHNYDVDGAGPGTAGQTLFALNDWGGNTTADNIEIGIGNNLTGNSDWTLVNTGQNYTLRNLYVFVQPVPEPSSLALLGFGAVLCGRSRRRAQR